MYRGSAVIVALGLVLTLTVAHAEMRGNTYSSLQHRISFTRPDASWELRENPARENAVALFSNGQGRVIALLSHRVLAPADVVVSPGDLRDRWSEFAYDIAAMGSPDETGITVRDADYEPYDDGVTFQLSYTSQSKVMGGKVRNVVTGLIVRDTDGHQHIYSLRCAAADNIYEAWESQFERILPTLTFDGQRQVPFYTSAPVPWWWFALGVLVLFVVIKLILRSRHTEPMESSRVRQEPAPPTLPPGTSLPGMVDDNTVPNVPDQMLVAADLDDSRNDIPDQVYHDAAAEGQTYNENATPAGFWKCDCGRLNPGQHEFCARCNADRVRA